MTLREAAALTRELGRPIAQSTLAVYVWQGRLKARREETPRGPVWYVTESELRRFLAELPPPGRPRRREKRPQDAPGGP